MKFVKLALVAGVVAGSAAAMAQETEGNWMVRGRVVRIDTNNDSDPIAALRATPA